MDPAVPVISVWSMSPLTLVCRYKLGWLLYMLNLTNI